MAYLSLYRKYRPQTFDEILGQEHVSRTLANAISEDRVSHAYLFTGPRGTGKTSTARILAKALNCERGPTPNPCGKCDSCVAIAEGSSLDVIELDAASHSGVDDTRDILAGVALASAGSHRKVYVIDEVHMLTTPSFNALLKTLEEPPPHVIFILATTEAHKVLHTIQSRTQRFDFRPIPTEVLQDHVAHVAKSEGIDIDAAALGVVARHAEGSARDALSVLDQLSSMQGAITAGDVERLLGGRAEDAFAELFDAIAGGDLGNVFWSVHSMVAEGADVRQLARGALKHARTLLLLRTAPDAADLLDVASEDRSVLATQAERFTPAGLLRAVDLLAKSLTEMRETPNHRLLFEVALVRAASPETDPSATGLLSRIERIERRLGIEGSAPAPAPTEPAPVPAAAPEEKPAASTPTQEPARGAEGTEVPAEVGFGHIRDAWGATRDELGRKSKRVAAFLNPSRPVSYDDDGLVVEVQSEFHAGEMAQDRNRDLLSNALFDTLGIKPVIRFVAQGSQTPAPEPEPRSAAEAADAKPVEDAHDPISLVKEGFGAEVIEEKQQ
jgi:DNA polymerase III subunit gamma/tau